MKKFRVDKRDVLMIKYFYWRGLSNQDLKTIFYHIKPYIVQRILDGIQYKTIELPFIKTSGRKLTIDKDELNSFESEHFERIKSICNIIPYDKKNKLSDYGIVGNKTKDKYKGFTNNVSELSDDMLLSELLSHSSKQRKEH